MLHSEIIAAIFARIDDATGLVPVVFPKEEFEKPSNGGPYAELHIVPNETVDIWHGNLKSGNILFNVSFSKYSKLIEPMIEAEKFLALFPEGLVFGGVSISDEGSIYSSVDDKSENGRFFIPVVIGFSAR